MLTGPLLNRIRQLEKLTSSEAKIAQFISRVYPLIALETVTSISEKAGVGKATVVRFISRLGYDGFTDFQEKVREELVQRLEPPIKRHSSRMARLTDEGADYLGQHINLARKTMDEVHKRIDPQQIQAAAEIMATSEGALYVQGQMDSHSLAHLFWTQAMYLRDRVRLISNLNSSLPHQLIDISEKDVLLAISRHRYTQETYLVTRRFAKQGAKIVLITDREVSPHSEFATVQLVVLSDGVSMFDSNCTRLVVLEALTTAMTRILDDRLWERAKVCETLFEDFSTFMSYPDGLPRQGSLTDMSLAVHNRNHKKKGKE